MSKVTELAEKYNITSNSSADMETFAALIMNAGYQACKETYEDKLGLRDHFAGLAMQGLLSSDKNAKWDEDDIALIAYGQADAMLKRKAKNG